MANELVSSREIDEAFETVSALIKEAKIRVANKINSEIVMLYWSIGRTITETVLHGERPDYGQSAVRGTSRASFRRRGGQSWFQTKAVLGIIKPR